jgi:hypothetical protein
MPLVAALAMQAVLVVVVAAPDPSALHRPLPPRKEMRVALARNLGAIVFALAAAAQARREDRHLGQRLVLGEMAQHLLFLDLQ